MIGTVGLGLMGSSIATCLLASGHQLIAAVKDPAEKAGALQRIAAFLKEMKEEGLLKGEPESYLQNITITSNLSDLAPCKLVVESVFENIDLKKEIYKTLEQYLAPDAIIGSNTSAIPVTLLQEGLKNPERFVGIHWAEPAHITRFMEIICGNKTDPSFAYKVREMAESWGKEPSVLKKDIRGFITNRIMYAMLREAFYLVEGGYATYEDVDRSLRNDLGYWITFAGPFRFMDLTGIPAYGAVMEGLLPELSNQAEVPEAMKTLLASGAKGVQNAKGFYSYSETSAKQWEHLFTEFSYEIRRLSEKYPQDIGDRPVTTKNDHE